MFLIFTPKRHKSAKHDGAKSEGSGVKQGPPVAPGTGGMVQ
jgi:hypothetical protein